MAQDKHSRHIEPGDVLKVFHFIDRRQRRRYMYKQALRYENGRLLISHLNRIDESEPWKFGENYYSVGADERLHDYEIVQSADAKLDERPVAVA